MNRSHVFWHFSSKCFKFTLALCPNSRSFATSNFLCKKVYKKSIDKESKITKDRRHYLNEDHEVTLQVVDYFKNIQNDTLFEDKSKVIHKLQTNVSQIFGFSLDVLKRRLELIKDSGLAKSDEMLLILSIPASFDICNPNFLGVVKCLQKFDLPVIELFRANPFIGSIDLTRLEENLTLLEKAGMKSALKNVILKNSILLSYPLTLEALNHLKRLHTLGLDQSKLLETSFYEPRLFSVQDKSLSAILREVKEINLSEVKDFLASYKIEIERIYRLCPEFLFISKEKLEACLEKAQSSPFFLVAEDIEKLLRNRPDVFLVLSDDKVTDVVNYIEKISTVKSRAFRLLNERPEIFRFPEKFNRRCDLFKSFGFKEADIARLFAVKGGPNCFVDCDDFSHHSMTEILEFYMSSKDLTPVQLVVSAPICFAKTHFPIIKQRFTYMRQLGLMKLIAPRKVTSKKGKLSLQSIIKCESEEFVKICKSTLEEYNSFLSKF